MRQVSIANLFIGEKNYRLIITLVYSQQRFYIKYALTLADSDKQD
ncbi:type II toxin-antitoxin system HigB family toxin [Chroococcidiopsis sp. FACHB-1243]|nr:type II toxin-antitoxin system HigB family toxin [Chroococcidiopsis sp. [FACHB-1243]]MBD2306754.1 type II toxin-antitoxin system HigB family toxin [Chroococcidiopsis sp. [FACHB-1243]]